MDKKWDEREMGSNPILRIFYWGTGISQCATPSLVIALLRYRKKGNDVGHALHDIAMSHA